MLVDEARSLPWTGAPYCCFTQVGLNCEYLIRLKSPVSDKHSSFVRCHFHFTTILTGKAEIHPSEGFAINIIIRVDVSESRKQSSLLRYKINYGRKMFQDHGVVITNSSYENLLLILTLTAHLI